MPEKQFRLSVVLTEEQFRLNLSQAIAEDDRDVCECCKCGASDLTQAGIDHLVEIAVAQAEPLFARIAELEQQVIIDYFFGGIR